MAWKWLVVASLACGCQLGRPAAPAAATKIVRAPARPDVPAPPVPVVPDLEATLAAAVESPVMVERQAPPNRAAPAVAPSESIPQVERSVRPPAARSGRCPFRPESNASMYASSRRPARGPGLGLGIVLTAAALAGIRMICRRPAGTPAACPHCGSARVGRFCGRCGGRVEL